MSLSSPSSSVRSGIDWDYYVAVWESTRSEQARQDMLRKILRENEDFKVPNEFDGKGMSNQFMKGYLRRIETPAAKKNYLTYLLNQRAMVKLKRCLELFPSLYTSIDTEMNEWITRLKAIPSIKRIHISETDETKIYLMVKPHRFAERNGMDSRILPILDLDDPFSFRSYLQRDMRTSWVIYTCDQPLLMRPSSWAQYIHGYINFTITRPKCKRKTNVEQRDPGVIPQPPPS